MREMFYQSSKINGIIKKIIIEGDRVSFLGAFAFNGNPFFGCEEFECLNSQNITSLLNLFSTSSAPKKIKFGSLENCSDFSNWIANTKYVETVEFDNWKKGNIILFNGYGNNINGESTQYIIEHAMSPEYDDSGNVTNGVVARTLTLQSKAKANFEALPNCEELRTLAT
jgi:hypothetical protein